MLERMAGLQAQYAPSMYIGLWSRLEGFERDALTRALEDARGRPGDADAQHDPPRLARRLLAAGDRGPRGAPRVVAAGHEARAARGRRRARCARRSPAAATLRRKEIEELIGKPAAHGVGLWVDLVRAPPSGTWERRRADLFALAEDWVGPPPEIDRDAAVEHLVRRYLGGFGPATAKDVASFTGLAARDSRPSSTAWTSAARATCSTSPARRSPTPTRPRRRGSSAPGTRACSSTRAAPASSPRSTARDLQHQGAAVVPDLPGRRRRRRHLAPRGRPHRAEPVRPARSRATRRALEAEAERPRRPLRLLRRPVHRRQRVVDADRGADRRARDRTTPAQPRSRRDTAAGRRGCGGAPPPAPRGRSPAPAAAAGASGVAASRRTPPPWPGSCRRRSPRRGAGRRPRAGTRPSAPSTTAARR